MYYLVTKALSKNVNNAWLAPFGTLSQVGAQYKKKKKSGDLSSCSDPDCEQSRILLVGSRIALKIQILRD